MISALDKQARIFCRGINWWRHALPLLFNYVRLGMKVVRRPDNARMAATRLRWQGAAGDAVKTEGADIIDGILEKHAPPQED